jgi:cbb3-type cytochrome oxidase cytochrome c subunit
VVLLLVTLAYGLTGYLLPWDNRAYWGTVVTTRIIAGAPIAGPYLARLLGGGDEVGVVTFARFYGLHVLLLPPATLLLIALHVYLVRKHGVAPAPGDELVPAKKFFPAQVFKDVVAIFAAFMILYVLAVAVRVPLEQLADPTDATYVPRPEWYFLFLFQALKLFPGPLEVIGSVVLPGAAIVALILVPFLDRSRLVKIGKRTFAAGVVVLAAIGWGGLTAAAIATTPKPEAAAEVDYSAPSDWLQLTPQEMAGIAYFRQEQCESCHAVGKDSASKVGPDLTRNTIHKDAAWMIQHFKRPSTIRPGSAMPPIQLSDAQLNALAAFLLTLNPDNASALANAPDFATAGALIYQANQCNGCHKVNGYGTDVGPALNGLAQRRSRSWVETHFADPPALSPGSIMPKYSFSPKNMENLVSYLFTLPTGANDK